MSTQPVVGLVIPSQTEPGYLPNYRHSDPKSSKLAGLAIEGSGKAPVQRMVALRAVRNFPGSTSRELATLCELDRYALARRLPELMRADMVRRDEDGEIKWYPVIHEVEQLKMWGGEV